MAKLSDRLKERQAELTPIMGQSSESTLFLEQIIDRPGGDTRPLNPDHVAALVESIKAVGLIQPLAVDSQGRLLAGGHRKAAIEHLLVYDFAVFKKWFPNGIPVRQYDFDALVDPDRALTIEVSENEKRQDYTPSEVRKLADRLKQAGYEDLTGRPAKGQKSVVLALSTIIGKSDKTVRRYLSDNQPSKDGQMSTFSSDVAKRQVEKWLKQEAIPPRVAELLKDLSNVLDES